MKLSIKCGYITNHCELLQSLNIITAWEITVCKGKDIIWCLLLQFEFHLIQKQSYESSQITISCYINWKGQQCMYITELGRNFYVAKFLCAMRMFNRSVRCEETLESCGFLWEISSSTTNWLTLSHGREQSLTLQVQYFKIRTELSLDGSLVAWQTQNARKLHYQL